MILLHATELSFALAGKVLFQRVSLQVKAGDFVVITGISGAGKTTLLRCLAGLQRPDAGKITYHGNLDPFLNPQHAKKFRSYLHQNSPLATDASVLENTLCGSFSRLRPWQGLWKFPLEFQQQALDILCAMELESYAHKKTAHLSGGERQRVAIARMLMQEARLLLADEPTSQLDFQTAVRVFDLLSTWIKARNAALICVVHDWRLAHAFATSVYELREGALILL